MQNYFFPGQKKMCKVNVYVCVKNIENNLNSNKSINIIKISLHSIQYKPHKFSS